MSQFEKAVKLSDEQFLRSVGVDKTALTLFWSMWLFTSKTLEKNDR